MAKAKLSKNAYRRQQAKLKPKKHADGTKSATPAPAATDAETKQNGDIPPNDASLAERAEPVKAQVQEPAEDTGSDAMMQNGHGDDDAMNTNAFSLDPELDQDDPLFQQYASVFAKFQPRGAQDNQAPPVKEKPKVLYQDDGDIPSEDEGQGKAIKMGKRAKRFAKKMTIAQLKSSVEKPELVEWSDTSSSDPMMLLAIRANRNIVPVPGHWSMKREYLSMKRGIEKPPFRLPKFIADTGIGASRDAILEQEANMTLKQKQRQRVQGKTGKLDIDYQKMHDAFFKFQTKPELTRYGEVYYEGKEWETNLKHLRPGFLSEELKNALNMSPGHPPPWLLNQQRFGPPPSYPGLRIPGLNAPPPTGASYGYHAGGYGKPPLNEGGTAAYGGDLLGQINNKDDYKDPPVDKSLWGVLQAPEEPEEESEDEGSEEEEDEEEEEVSPAATSTPAEPVVQSIESFGEDVAPARRQTSEEGEDTGQRSLYTVIQEQKGKIEGFMGGSKRYDIKTAEEQARGRLPVLGQEQRGQKRKAGDVDVSIDVEALERDDKLTKAEARKLYDESAEVQNAKNPWSHNMDEDLNAMIEEESNKRLKKDKEDRARRERGRRDRGRQQEYR